MRTIAQIESNISDIHNAEVSIYAQIALLEKEYQSNAIEMIGERCDFYDQLIDQLKSAVAALNGVFHLELDSIDRIKNPDDFE